MDTTCICKIIWPFYLLPCLICHVSSSTPVSFSLTPSSLQVMLWFGSVYLSPLPQKPYFGFTNGRTAEPLGILTFFFLSPPTLPETRSHLQTPVLLSSCFMTPTTSPRPACTGRDSRHRCLWLRHSPLFDLTTHSRPDNSRKGGSLASWWVYFKELTEGCNQHLLIH